MARTARLVQVERGDEINQLLNNVSIGTLAAIGIKDVYIKDGEIHIADKVIKPLTASSDLSADKITGIIDASHIRVGDGLYVNAHGVLSISLEENDCLWEYDDLNIMPRSDSAISTIVDGLWRYDNDGNLTTYSGSDIGEVICSKWKLDGYGNIKPRLAEYGTSARTRILAEDDYEDMFDVPAGTTQEVFALTYVPYAGIRMYISGIRYYEDCFTYDKTTNTVTWIYTAANGGFDITDAEVVFNYDVAPDN